MQGSLLGSLLGKDTAIGKLALYPWGRQGKWRLAMPFDSNQLKGLSHSALQFSKFLSQHPPLHPECSLFSLLLSESRLILLSVAQESSSIKPVSLTSVGYAEHPSKTYLLFSSSASVQFKFFMYTGQFTICAGKL